MREGAEPGRHTESKRGECGWGGPATRGSRGREVSGVRLGERRAGQAGLVLDRVPSRVGVWGCPGRRNSLGVGVRAGGGAGAEEGLEGARAAGACHYVPRALLLVSEVSGMPDCRSRLMPQPQGWETRGMPQEGRPLLNRQGFGRPAGDGSPRAADMI